MKIIYNRGEFMKLVDPVIDTEFCEYDDIEFDTISGLFFPDRMVDLERYCGTHRELHIISSFNDSDILANKAVPGAELLMLGIGNNDPEIYWVREYSQNIIENLKIAEFNRD